MFIQAIEKANRFTRPIHSIFRMTGSDNIIPGSATLFFVNDEGFALTCKHVVKLLTDTESINREYSRNPKKALIQDSGKIIQVKNTFVDCIDRFDRFTIHTHPTLDLAIIKFEGFNRLLVEDFPVFKKNTAEIKQGKFLCRLGYPFPEFSNFRYNTEKDDLEWTNNGNPKSPVFPIEGMVTRFLGNPSEGIYGIELSTPGLKGQSGGPLFDENGIIYGIQSRTKHLHLGFDLENMELFVKGRKKRINDYSFIHLGECIHVDAIKVFLRQHNVTFNEE
jgi:hypothetical protein